MIQSLSAARPLLAVAAATMLAAGLGPVLPTALVVVLELTDFIDGLLARKLGATSDFGRLFDPYCDSVSRLIVFFGLAAAGRGAYWLIVVMAARDQSVAYLRMSAIRKDIVVSARVSGKAKAVVQGVSALVLLSGPLWWGEWGGDFVRWLVGLVAVVTVLSLFDYVIAVLRALKAKGA